MTVISGRFAKVNGVSTVRNFSITDTLATVKMRASNTKAGVIRLPGIGSWSGNFNYYGVLPPAIPAQIFEFLGFAGPTSGVDGENGATVEGDAIVDSIVTNWNWQNGESLSQTLNFSGHLGMTWGTNQTDTPDETTPTVMTVCGTKITYSADGTTWTELTELVSASLTITAENGQSVNSGTACNTARIPGPIDWTASITREAETKGALVKGNDYQWRFYTDSNSYFLLKWGKVKEFSNLNYDIESGAVVTHTVNLEMQGMVSGVLGSITLPDAEETMWPVPVEA